MRAETPVLGRRLQKVHHFAQLDLGLIDPGDVVEADAGGGFDIDLGVGLAERHEPAHALLLGHAPDEKHPHRHEEHRRQQPTQQVAHPVRLDHAAELHAVTRQVFGEGRLDAGGDEALAAVGQRLLEPSFDVLIANLHFGDAVVAQVLFEFTVGQGLDLRVLHPPGVKTHHQHDGEQGIAEIDLMGLVHGGVRGVGANAFAQPRLGYRALPGCECAIEIAATW